MKIFSATLAASILATYNLANAESAPEFYTDILPIVEDKCLACHSQAGVSFSFEDPEVTYSFGAAMTAAVSDGRMPPWLAEPGHRAYVDDYSLTPDEKAVFAAWAGASHPRDVRQRKRHQSTMTAKDAVFESNLTLTVNDGRSYLPNQKRKDDYRCFIVEWPYGAEKYVTGFKGEPGNLRIAHHVVNFAIGPESADMLRELSAAEEGDGFSCFGGPMPDKMADDEARAEFDKRHPGGWEQLQNDYFWLSHWAPGTYSFEFPENTGVLIEPGSVVVVQMHYYSAFAPGESDANTTLHFQVADTVEKPSVIFPLTKNAWLRARQNESMTVPPGGEATYEIADSFEQIAKSASSALRIDFDDIAALELQSANVHMHAFGAAGNTSLIDGHGKKQTLLNIPRWDLDWQRDFAFAEPIRIDHDDLADTRLAVECRFANHTDELVYGGYGSDDEMCLNLSYISVVLKADSQVAVRTR